MSTTRTLRPERVGSERPSAETTPAVTEPGEPVRVADRDDELADPQPLASPSSAGTRSRPSTPQDREVPERIGADDLEVELAAVDEGGASLALGARDHVRRREREAVGRDHDAAAASVEDAAASDASRDTEVRDGWRKPLARRS